MCPLLLFNTYLCLKMSKEICVVENVSEFVLFFISLSLYFHFLFWCVEIMKNRDGKFSKYLFDVCGYGRNDGNLM